MLISLYFRETLQNINPVFNDNGTLTFTPKRSVKFMPELSVGDPETTYIYVPNVPLLVSIIFSLQNIII